MPLSTDYNNLKTRIKNLETRFLNFANADSLLQDNQDRLMSFRLLVHAEIEHYLEESARRIINHLHTVWIASRNVLPGFKFLLLYSPNKFDSNAFQSINDRVNACYQSFISRIGNNHGIKPNSIISLFVPLGLTQAYLDIAWLTTLDSYGSRRGSYAHQSFSVQTPITKVDELNDLRNVLLGLSRMDIKLQSLIRPNLRQPF